QGRLLSAPTVGGGCVTSGVRGSGNDTSRPDANAAPEAAAARAPERVRRSRLATALLVLVLGFAITSSLTWATVVQDRNAERRLLLVATKQAGLLIETSIPATLIPLTTAAKVAKSTNGSVLAFRRYMSTFVGNPTGFLVTSLWEVRNGRATALAWLGGHERPSRALATD